MSGIVGMWNRDGAPVSSALLASLNQTLAHRGPDGARQWTDGAINPLVGSVGTSMGQSPVQRCQEGGRDRRPVTVPNADNPAHW